MSRKFTLIDAIEFARHLDPNVRMQEGGWFRFTDADAHQDFREFLDQTGQWVSLAPDQAHVRVRRLDSPNWG